MIARLQPMNQPKLARKEKDNFLLFETLF